MWVLDAPGQAGFVMDMALLRASTRSIGTALVAALSAGTAFAAPVPPSVEPGRVEKPFEPRPAPPVSDVTIPQADGISPPENADEITFVLSSLTVEGSTVFTPEEFAPLYREKLGTRVSLADLYKIAGAITERYGARGYALCLAFLPAQRISDGNVRIQVVEGYVDAIDSAADSDPLPRVAASYLERLKQSKPLKSADLERALLLANDVPGLQLRGTFDKGHAGSGATRLIVAAKQDHFSGALQASNRGSEAVGRYLAQTSASANALFGIGEQFSVDSVQSFQWNELHFIAGRASLPVGDRGTRLSASLSYSESDPGTPDLDLLSFVSNGWTGDIEASHPLVRSRRTNISLKAGLTAKFLDSDLLGATNSSDRIYAAYLGGTYSWNDRTTFAQIGAHVRHGLDIFDATSERSANRSRAAGSGAFTSLALRADVDHVIDHGIALKGGVEAQAASRGLLASEECGFGGEPFGRGFDSSEIVGDHCFKAMVELRAAPFVLANSADVFGDLSRSLTLHAFYDAGVVFQEGAIFPGERRQETAHTLGVGLRVSPLPHLSATVEYAVPLDRGIALEGDDGGRVFFSIKSEW